MKLASFKRIFSKDFPSESQDLVDKMSLSINPGIEDVHLALSNRLTFVDNFQAQIQDITVTVDSLGTPTSGLTIKITDPTLNISGIIIIGCRDTGNSTRYPTSAPFMSWTSGTNSIKVNNITGLIPDVAYAIRLLIF